MMHNAIDPLHQVTGAAEASRVTGGLLDVLLQQAAVRPQNRAILQEEQTITYAALAAKTAAISAQLQSLGVKRGDKVGLLFPNDWQLVACFFAILSVGAVVVPVNPLLKSEEVAHILGDSGAVAFIAHETGWEEVNAALASNVINVKHILVAGKNAAEIAASARGTAGAEQYVVLTTANGDSSRLAPIAKTIDPAHDLALIMYTSGTTGKPKGAMMTHGNLMSVAPEPLFHGLALSSTDRWLGVLPMCHIYGVGVLVYTTVATGGTLVIVPKFDAKVVLETIERHSITMLPAVPSMYQFMLMELEQQKYDLSSIRICLSAAAPLSTQLFHRIENSFASPVIEGYALTETACGGTINPISDRKIGSIGMALKGIDIVITAEDGAVLPAGSTHVGEITIRGANVMKGYHNQPAATADVIRDGWFFTGDLGYRDENNYLYIVGRKKELIIRGGQNIYPREIEDVIVRIPCVLETAVIGIPDELMGERVKAVVVCAPGTSLSEDEIKSHCSRHLAPYKIPRIIEFRTQPLPRNSTGKVLKRLLS